MNAKKSLREAHRIIGLQCFGGGLLMGIVSLVLIQYIPIRLFFVGILASPIPVLLGLGFFIRSFFPYTPLLHVGEPCPANEMVRIECVRCGKMLTTPEKMLGTDYECPYCNYKQSSRPVKH